MLGKGGSFTDPSHVIRKIFIKQMLLWILAVEYRYVFIFFIGFFWPKFDMISNDCIFLDSIVGVNCNLSP